MADKSNMDFSVNRNYRGMMQDNNPVDQPQGTYLFALNAIVQNETGDSNFLSNELSNDKLLKQNGENELPEGFIIIGTCYIGDNETCLFLVSEDNSTSMITVLDANDHIDLSRTITDKDSLDDSKLNFKKEYPIKSTYRLRLGCEKVIYWTDKYNKPRYYNFARSDEFLVHGKIHNEKFNIQSNYLSIPNIHIEVEDVGGNLSAGSYRIGVQYVDNNNNATEWVAISPQVLIYNKSISANFNDIWGNISFEEGGNDYAKSNKAISIRCTNLDYNYPYIRYAFIEYTKSDGKVSSVKISPKIPSKQSDFVYTGDNAETKGTIEEITQYNNVIETVGEITQIDNKLIFGNIQNTTIDYCQFQQYASLITADCITREINIDTLDINDPSNPKHPLHNDGHIGYFPGEIYSFGIKYYLNDGSETPVFHIPGKSPKDDPNRIYSSGDNVHPMNNDNNQIQIKYQERQSCNTGNYWGRDNTNQNLRNQNVRHHRFPTRKELNLSLFNVDKIGKSETNYKYTYSFTFKNLTPDDQEKINAYLDEQLKIKSEEWKKENCKDLDEEAKKTCQPSEELLDQWTQEIKNNSEVKNFKLPNEVFVLYLKHNDETLNYEFTYNATQISDNNNQLKIKLDTYSEEQTFTFDKLELKNKSNLTEEEQANIIKKYFGNIEYDINYDKYQHDSIYPNKHTTTILGIRFSNIVKPQLIGNKKVVGYKIVRNERTTLEKTILDSAVLLPTVKYNKYISCGLLAPDTDGYGEARDCWGLIHLENKFLHKKYTSFSSLTQEGSFKIDKQCYGLIHENNVIGSSLEYAEELDREDTDGWSLAIGTRDSKVSYQTNNKGFKIEFKDIKQLEYLNPLEHCTIRDNNNEQFDFFNAAADTPLAILQLKKPINKNIIPENTYPYVYFHNDKKTSYTNFQTLPYYDEHNEVKKFNEEVSSVDIFNGDSNISAIKYIHSIFIQNETALRSLKPKKKKSVWEWIVTGIAVVLGVGITVLSLGSLSPLGIALATLGAGLGIGSISLGLMNHSANQKREVLEEAFTKHYNRGLRGTIYDKWVGALFGRKALRDKSIFKDIKFPSDEYTDKYSNVTHQQNPYFNKIKLKLDKSRISWFDDHINWQTPVIMPGSYWDDTIIWILDALSDLWFESTINGFLRIQLPSYASDFIPAPSIVEDGNLEPLTLDYSKFSEGIDKEHWYSWIRGKNIDMLFVSDDIRIPVSALERYAYKKFLIPIEANKAENSEQTVAYIGVPTGEYYGINYDYFPNANIKRSYLLAQDYNCCTECKEKFPHRIMWSESSFDEEISDNFKIFKANNYKDLPGNTGEINNLAVYNNNLLIHTDEGLYIQPRNIQERITDEIISFIGTGEYGSLPAQRIVNDDNGMSAGLQHRFGALKFQYGYVFVSERERKVYLFDKRLNQISEQGMSRYFQNNLPIQFDTEWNKKIKEKYTLKDNSFNKLGTGYNFGYDSEYVRILLSKHDLKLNQSILNKYIQNEDDYYFDDKYIFNNYYTKYNQLINEGYKFNGIIFRNIDNKKICSAKFSKHVYGEYTKIIKIEESVFKDIDYLVFYYDFTNDEGRVDLDTHTQLIYPYESKILGWSRDSSDSNNDIFWSKDNTGNGLESILIDIKNLKTKYPNLKEIKFECGAFWYSDKFTSNGPVKLKAIPYKGGEIKLNGYEFKNYGGENLLPEGYIFGTVNIDVKGSQQTTNIIGTGILNLENGNLSFNGKSGGNANQKYTITKEREVIVNELKLEHKYIDAIEIDQKDFGKLFNHNIGSWTISYSLRNQSWTSFHSYIPNTYFSKPNKMYSFVDQKNNYIWKHNKDFTHQMFYDKNYKFIIEYVDNKNPTITKIWNHLQFNTEALVYDKELDIYHEDKYSTFQNAILYNTRQSSGLLIMVPKDKELDKEYIEKQVKEASFVYIDKHEGDWYLNDFRDLQKDPKISSWNKDTNIIQTEEFIDKALNTVNIDLNKDWTQQEKFRDKYLIIRLEFNNFVDNKDVKLISKLNIQNQQQSIR